MSDDIRFERNARAWLEPGPTQAPQHVVQAALTAVDTTPQQRTIRVPRRTFRMTTPFRLALAATLGLLVIAGGFLFFQRPPTVGKPTPLPTNSPPLESPTIASPVAGDIQIAPGWLVFERRQRPPAGAGMDLTIWAVHQDGSGLHEIAPEIDGKQSPDISPDGSTVAFEIAGRDLERKGPSRIWIAPIDGGQASVVGHACGAYETCRDTNPAYSPDGSRIAFVRNGVQIGFVDLATGDVTELSTTESRANEHLAWPTWSNDQRIAYQATVQVGDGPASTTVLVINADNTNLRTIDTPVDVSVGDPHWSPDGSQILLSAKADRYDTATDSAGLYTVSTTGAGFKQLCAGSTCGIDPSWTPDGQSILFWRDGTWWVMDAQSALQRPIDSALAGLSSFETGAFVVRLQPGPGVAISVPPSTPPIPVTLRELMDAWASVGKRANPEYGSLNFETFVIDATGLRIGTFRGDVVSAVTDSPDGSIVLELENQQADLDGFRWPCTTGDEGRYVPRLSLDRQTLTLTSATDNCAPRTELLAGEWTRWPCDGRDFSYCNHVTEAVPGVQSSIFRPFDGGTSGSFSYTVPTGWANVADPPTWPGRDSPTATSLSQLVSPSDPSISLFSDASAEANTPHDSSNVCHTTSPTTSSSSEVADWMGSLANVVVDARSPVTVGGLSGIQLDVSVAPGASDACDRGDPVVLFRVGQTGEQLFLDGATDEHARYIVLDQGSGGIVLISVQTAGKAAWESLLSKAMPVIDTFQFEREVH